MTEIPDLPFGPPRRRRKAPPDKKPELPPAADKSADLDALKKTVEDAASVSGGLWLSYLFALFYIAVATGAVTHADLFLQHPVKLPFLNIELPLLAFFALAPILFLITHAYTLVHFVLLAAKAKRFHAELKAQIKEENVPDAAVMRNRLREQLPSNIFVQILAGPRELREGLFGRFLAFISWITLIIGPLALLLLLQLKFLPYHDSSITWTHRVALLLDCALVWWLWPKILAGQTEVEEPRWRPSWGRALSLVATMGVVVFSWTVATFPGEWERPPLIRIAAIAPLALNKWRSAANEWLFNAEVDPITHWRASWFSNTLVLSDFNLYRELKIDDPKKVEWRRTLFDARERDLKGVVFDGAILPRTDFSGAQLQGASLFTAELKGARFDHANLEGASLKNAHLQGATFYMGQLNDSLFDFANLQGAFFAMAELQGASLQGVQLRGGMLDAARLQGASLYFAQLQGASLQGAQLQSASFQGANLLGARLDRTDMTATNLSNAFVWRAVFPQGVNKMSASGLYWRPELSDGSKIWPWTSASYEDLRREIEEIVPEGLSRTAALERIHSLDCKSAELASCDPTAPEPASIVAERQMIEQASLDDATYKKALAGGLGDIVCGGDGDTVQILNGIIRNHRINETAAEVPALVERIMSKDCPVSALLTDEGKAYLRAMAKQAAPVPARNK